MRHPHEPEANDRHIYLPIRFPRCFSCHNRSNRHHSISYIDCASTARSHFASPPVGGSGFGCAFSHSARVTSFTSCLKTNTPFLLPTTTSGYLGLLTIPTVTSVPTPESSSIRWGINSAWPLAGRTSLNQ